MGIFALKYSIFYHQSTKSISSLSLELVGPDVLRQVGDEGAQPQDVAVVLEEVLRVGKEVVAAQVPGEKTKNTMWRKFWMYMRLNREG